MLSPTDEPTTRAKARELREELGSRLIALHALKDEIDADEEDIHERLRAGSVELAIEHVEIAMAALIRAAEE